MKVLVTGGTGYIGSHTVVELQNNGFDVVIIDNLSNSQEWIVDSIAQITGKKPDFYKFDLQDKEKTLNFFRNNKDFDGIIHFAAYKAVGESVQQPLKYYQNNLISLMNIIEAMQENGLNNLVFSSSCTVYGQPDVLPVTEQTEIKKAFSPYGNTKIISEQIIQDSFKDLGKTCISLRYFNPIGAHDSGLIGELPQGIPNNLLPFITQTAVGKRECLYVFGDDYNTSDGTCIRDYIHVVDLAKAHVIALNRMIAKACENYFEVFNLGTGMGNSVMEVVKTFEKVSGMKLNYKIVERRPGDVESIYANVELANIELQWKAEKTLEEMVQSSWLWEQNILKHKK